MSSEGSTPILTIYHKHTRNGDGTVVTKFIIFDEEIELPFIYSSEKRIPGKLYLEPIKGKLVRETMDTYIQKNGYQKALTVKQLITGEKEIIDYHVICDTAGAKEAMSIIMRKFNDYAYDDRDSMIMCAKLNICMHLYN